MRSSLNAAEIARMSEALYGKLLADDEAFRFGGRAFVVAGVEWMRRNEDKDFELPTRWRAFRNTAGSPSNWRSKKNI